MAGFKSSKETVKSDSSKEKVAGIIKSFLNNKFMTAFHTIKEHSWIQKFSSKLDGEKQTTVENKKNASNNKF